MNIFNTAFGKALCGIEISCSLLVDSIIQVNPDNSLAECDNCSYMAMQRDEISVWVLLNTNTILKHFTLAWKAKIYHETLAMVCETFLIF